MQQIESMGIESQKPQIPYITLSGVLALMILFIILWRPLNPNRTTYIPLTTEVQTTVERQSSVAVVDNAIIERIDKTAQGDQITDSLDQPKPEDDIVKDEIDEEINIRDDLTQHTVSRGDTLYGIMTQYGVNRSDIYQLTKQYNQLANLRIGQQISWEVDEEHNLKTFNWIVSNSNVKIYERHGDTFTEKIETREGIWTPLSVVGTIDSNFVIDAKKAQLTNGEISTITKALQWQLDFRRLQKGDKFAVLLSRETFGNEHTASQLQAVRIQNGNRDYYAVLAEDGHYYDMNGNSLSENFLRYPLEKQARISSQFNPRRLNPVTKKITSHNGIDFAVSRGTPVLSIGEGEVVIARYSGSAGNFIAIRHGRQYTTRYMHMDKILVKAGQKVKKGDQIGLSGNTGRSTGPHLHYELHIDGKPVNPLTATLPVSEGLTGKSKTTFLAQFKEVKNKLLFENEQPQEEILADK